MLVGKQVNSKSEKVMCFLYNYTVYEVVSDVMQISEIFFFSLNEDLNDVLHCN